MLTPLNCRLPGLLSTLRAAFRCFTCVSYHPCDSGAYLRYQIFYDIGSAQLTKPRTSEDRLHLGHSVMLRGLDIGPEIVNRNFIRSCTTFSSPYDVKCSSSGSRTYGTTLSMGSMVVCEDSWSVATSSVMVAERNHSFTSNGVSKPGVDNRREADGEGQSLRVETPSSRRGYTEIFSSLSQQSGLSTLGNLADTRSLLSIEERGSNAEAGNRAEDRSEGEKGFGKRLKIQERLVSNPVEDAIERRIAIAWDHWRKLGEPKMHVAPMVDQSELPFRMLCRKYGATAAYTPMLHSRLFAKDAKYRSNEFTTCPEDRPLFVQFCANNPDTLLEAARLVEPYCDYVDINLGCPQRIAKKGNYGAFLMDNLPLIKSLVANLSSNLTVPVSCKIRVFPDLEDTLAYARMLEEAGCSLLAVHGRTRDQKNGKLIRADWEAIRAVKKALRIPVLGNGNIRWLEDVYACMAHTGVDGVMSAESLLENPALYAGYHPAHIVEDAISEETSGIACHTGEARLEKSQTSKIDARDLMLEYLNLCEEYPVPMRMVRGHVHKILGNFWFRRNPDIREELNKQHKLTVDWLKDMVHRLMARFPRHSSLPPITQEPQENATDAAFPSLELPPVTSAAAAPHELLLSSTSGQAS